MRRNQTKIDADDDHSEQEDDIHAAVAHKEDLKKQLLKRGARSASQGMKEQSSDSDGDETHKIKKKVSVRSRSTTQDESSESDDGKGSNDSNSDNGSSGGSDSSQSSEGSLIGGNRRKLTNRKGFSKFMMHLKLLLMKNFWIFRRNIKLTMIQLIAPVLFCILIVFFEMKSHKWADFEITHPMQYDISHVPRCHGDPDCVTIGYSIIGDSEASNDDYAYINEIMENIANENQLLFKKDVKLLTVGSPDDFYDHLKNNPNETWYSVVWCTSEWPVTGNLSIPCKYQNQQSSLQKKTTNSSQQNVSQRNLMLYSVYYNLTMADNAFFKAIQIPAPIDPILLRLKLSVDNSIMRYLGRQKGLESDDIPNIEISHSSYPIVADRVVKDTNLVSQMGGYFFVLGPLLSFTIILNEIVREKELKLRQGLQVVGVGHSVYWLSWISVGLVFSFLTSVTLLFTGLVCQFDVFWNTPLLISFLVFFFFSMAMTALAFFVSTLVSTQASANQVAYTFVLVTIIFQIVFSQQDLNNLFLYNDDTRHTLTVSLMRTFFQAVPSFTFSVCFGAIVKVASTHLDPQLIIWVKGRRYSWDDFLTRETGSIVLDATFTMPSGFETLVVLIGDMTLYLFLTWYFDHVISHNRGVADPPYFMFTKKYWQSWWTADKDLKQTIKDAKMGGNVGKKGKKSKRDVKVVMGDYQNTNEEESNKNSVKKEKRKVKDSEREGVICQGLRVMGLKKTYFQKSFGRKSSKDVHAVRGIYLEVPDRELLCLLGHNGAGKSTLFSMLTGVNQPTKGSAKICGFDIETQIDEIRLIMGVVPQFDILWGELTAVEHMTMFSMIKGVHPDDINEMTDELLESVGLMHVKYARVMNFSGGMKRRLSVAISSIGNPRIIFMDEPTTGMDPVSRRDVWNLIQRLKRNKVIVLTTHAMEEADILSDRLAIVCDGKLKCVGTPLYLKNTYGDGYRISLVCEPGNEQKIINLMAIVSPSSKLIDESGGSMVFSVPLQNTHEISKLFSLIEEGETCLLDGGIDDSLSHLQSPHLKELKSLLKDIGISHTTLEEVFMKVTGKKKSKMIPTASSLSGVGQLHPVK